MLSKAHYWANKCSNFCYNLFMSPENNHSEEPIPISESLDELVEQDLQAPTDEERKAERDTEQLELEIRDYEEEADGIKEAVSGHEIDQAARERVQRAHLDALAERHERQQTERENSTDDQIT